MHLVLQISATCKHFAAYSLEVADSYTRASFDARVSERCRSPSFTPNASCFRMSGLDLAKHGTLMPHGSWATDLSAL